MLARLALVGGVLAGLIGCGDDPAQCPNDLPPACPEDGGVPSYQNDIAPLIQMRCYPCHGPGGIEQPVHDFTTYMNVFNQRTDILTQVHACHMPPADAPPLSEDQRVLLQTWLVCHAPNN